MTRPLLIIVALAGLGSWLPSYGAPAISAPEGAVALTTGEIRERFSGVRDHAEVQDEESTRAVNDWYADGRFLVRWSNQSESGEVSGKWWAENNMRCIEIQSGLADREGVTSCSPVYRQGDVLLSVERDGRIHGVHRLTPLLGGSDRSFEAIPSRGLAE